VPPAELAPPKMAAEEASPTEAEVLAALEQVVDPCSVTAGTPLSLVDMGLVVGWSYAGGVLDLSLTVTGPGCTYLGLLADAAGEVLGGLPEVTAVCVTFVPDIVWDESRLSDRGHALLAHRRQRTVTALGLRPRMWQEARSLAAVDRP